MPFVLAEADVLVAQAVGGKSSRRRGHYVH
jgi:hypothetical protein